MNDDVDSLQRAIEQLGYKVLFRQNVWWECLIAGAGCWHGQGADAPGALRNALQSALPTPFARAAFDHLVGAALSTHPQERRRVSTPPAAPSRPPPPVAAAAPVAPTVAMPEAPPEPKIEVTVPAPALVLTVPPVTVPLPGGATLGAATIPSPPPQPEPPRILEEPVRHQTPREVLADIKAMRKQIETDAEELALATPRRQRLVLLGWITRARAAQTAFPDDPRIDQAVAALARALTGYCQVWWPGSVRSLKVTTRPEDVIHDLTIQVDRPPMTWQEAADLAERNMRVIDEDDEHRGRDGAGWLDSGRLTPAPRDADAMLAEVITAVEALSGPIVGAPTSPALPEAPAFLEWARKLRWARDTTSDPGRWGALMGRFRYWLRDHAKSYPEVARTLDADYLPEKSWAAVLGLDPETIARARELRELFSTPPTPESAPAPEVLHQWLARALVHSDTHLPQIVAAMQPFRDAVVALEGNELPGADRRMRRRLSKLQKELTSPEPTEAVPSAEPPVPERPELPSDPVPDNAAVSLALREPILPYTRGKRALFVSNRADPTLRDRLKNLFEFEDLEWSAGETKRRQSLTNPIQSGAYQFVLGATGFLSHSIDGQISQACRKGKVPYVRVHRGRPLACLRAMARELGLEEGSAHPATLPPAYATPHAADDA